MPRAHYAGLAATLRSIDITEFRHRVDLVNSVLLQRGVTFTVYSDSRGTERILPFDLIPRIVPGGEWALIKRGIAQRVMALNAFLGDIYGPQRILHEGRISAEMVFSSKFYNREMVGFRVPRDVYIHVSGCDLIRAATAPTTCSRTTCARRPAFRTYSRTATYSSVRFRGCSNTINRCRSTTTRAVCSMRLRHSAPAGISDPTVVLLTPGIYNSAYFEHTVLARRMGVELVEGSDLLVHDNIVYMKTTKGLQRVDVIYRPHRRRVLGPLVFKADSTLGVAGLMNAYRAGAVGIANAVGTGVADDKAIYPFVPEIIRFYLGEEPILPNVPTYDCTDDLQRRHVTSHLDELVVKNTNQSAGTAC